MAFSNYISPSKNTALAEIFTDIHPTIITKFIENNDAVIRNIGTELKDNKKTSIFYNHFTNYNVNYDNVSSILNDGLIARAFGITKKIEDNSNLSLLLSYFNSFQKFDTSGEYNSQNYLVGANINKNYEKFSIDNMLTYTKSYNQGERKTEINEINKVSNTSDILSLTTKIKMNLSHNLKATASYKLDRVRVNGFKEENKRNLKQEILDTVMYKNSVNLGLDSSININKFTISNSVGMNINFNTKNYLKTKLNNTEFDSKGQDLKRILAEYKLGVKYMVDKNISISTKAYINTSKKAGTSITFNMILQ